MLASMVEKQSVSILIADDDTDLQEAMVAALSAARYRVEGFCDGDALFAALEQARRTNTPPALIVSDVCMPRASGLQVLRTLRSWGWQLPMLLITGFGTEELVTDAISLGATAVLRKPFDMEDFRTMVEYLV